MNKVKNECTAGGLLVGLVIMFYIVIRLSMTNGEDFFKNIIVCAISPAAGMFLGSCLGTYLEDVYK